MKLDVFQTELTNGLKILLLKRPHFPVATLQIWYQVGSSCEPIGQSGLSHLTEHLMFRGAQKYGPQEYSRIIQKLGGQDNAFTGKDHTVYYANLSPQHLGVLLDLESDRMAHLALNEEKFAVEKKVVKEERRLRYETDPVTRLLEEVEAMAFKAHPYQWPIIGWMEDLDRLTYDQFLSFYKNHYLPNQAILVAVGDFERDPLLDRIKDSFSPIPPGPPQNPPDFTEPIQITQRRVILKSQEAKLPFVILAFQAPNHFHPDHMALEGLSYILSSGKSSRLYDRMVYREPRALYVETDYRRVFRYPYGFWIYVQGLPGTSPEDLETVLWEEIDRLKEDPPTPWEMEKARNQAVSGFLFGQEASFRTGLLLGHYESLGGWQGIESYLPAMAALVPEDLRRAARTYLKKEAYTSGWLIPENQQD
jgi:zinc protease